MEKKDFLTTEGLSKRFNSPFDLVNYAIELAQNAIKTGRAMRITSDVQNLSEQLLLEILNNRDTFEEVNEERVVIETKIEIIEETPPSTTKAKTKGSKTAAHSAV